MNLSPFETHATIVLHRQELLREAERERLLAAGQPQRGRLGLLLARTGRALIAIGTRLEARYVPSTPEAAAHAVPGHSVPAAGGPSVQ